jgi:hypothetical protein
MLPYKPFLLLFAALSASAAPVDAEPAALAPSNGPSNAGPAAAFSPNCSPWSNWYGNGRWTYVEVQFCFDQTNPSTIAVVSQANGQYYWGGAWYHAKYYSMGWTIQGTVAKAKDSKDEDFQGSGTTTGGAGTTTYFTFSEISPGNYNVTLTYDQVGPYWGYDAAIHEPTSFTIVLGS